MDPKLHVSLDVKDLEKSVAFYSTLFGAEPAKRKPGYAKFELDQPGLVLALQEPKVAPCCVSGLNHMGIRVKSTAQVLEMRDRLQQAGLATLDEMNTVCCYAVQDKIWATDPTGYRWEIYVFKGDTEEAFNAAHVAATAQGACSCATEAVTAKSCC